MVFLWQGQEVETISIVIRVQGLLANNSVILAELKYPWALDSWTHTHDFSAHAMLDGTGATMTRFIRRR